MTVGCFLNTIIPHKEHNLYWNILITGRGYLIFSTRLGENTAMCSRLSLWEKILFALHSWRWRNDKVMLASWCVSAPNIGR